MTQEEKDLLCEALDAYQDIVLEDDGSGSDPEVLKVIALRSKIENM